MSDTDTDLTVDTIRGALREWRAEAGEGEPLAYEGPIYFVWLPEDDHEPITER